MKEELEKQESQLLRKLLKHIVSRKWRKVNLMLETEAVIEEVRNFKSKVIDGASILSIAVCFNPPLNILKTILSIAPSHSVQADKFGMLPLHLACMSGVSSKIVKCLLKHDRGSTAKVTNIFNRTPLHYAAIHAVKLEPPFVKQMEEVGSGSSVDATCPPGLKVEEYQDQIKTVQALLSVAPGQMLVADNENKTPIDIMQDMKASCKTRGPKWERADIIHEIFLEVRKILRLRRSRITNCAVKAG